MSKLKGLREKYDRRMKVQREMVEEEYKRRTMKKKIEETKTRYYDQDTNNRKISEESDDGADEMIDFRKSKTCPEEGKQEVTEMEDEISKTDLQKLVNDNSRLRQQIILLSGQLAPIMDRVGRVYTDFSPHLVSDVNKFNNEIRPRENRNQDRRRNRRRHQTEQQDQNRNRSQENSRGSDLEEDFDDEMLSNSSNSLSRNSTRSNDAESRQNRHQEGSTNIRHRLRSLSNTISQIRSSISSMRSLIFNNLGRPEGEENVEEELGININQSNSRMSTVNIQVPIISSPGDIASVHNIFDRFVDRQMLNVNG